ncbi:MAG: flagellar FliJ family protein [Planctomycetota bacterium]|jgi:flagellar export protein FliJ|nr:flagellar FliJ family protein [Planctomycetota bacterium]
MSPKRLAPVIAHAGEALDRLRAHRAERVRVRDEQLGSLERISVQRTEAAVTVPFEQREQFLRFCAGLDLREQALHDQIGALNAELDDLRDQLLAAHRYHRSLEFLRDRELAALRKQEERRQARSGDEQAVRNWLAEAS